MKMIIGCMRIRLYAAWVHSLKEKRMIVKSIISKCQNKFNISIAEVEDQDIHQTIGLGISCVTTDKSHANSILDEVLNFIESSFETEIVDYEIELL